MRRIPFLLLLLVLVVGHQPVASVPVPVFASPNVEFLGNVPDIAPLGGRTVEIDGVPYLFTTGLGGLTIFDLSRPETPVPVGALPLPIWENEDIDLSVASRTAVMSVDGIAGESGLFVIDFTNLKAPTLRGFVPYPLGPRLGDKTAGHIANCLLDCSYVWVTGAREGQILSLGIAQLPSFTMSWFDSGPAGGSDYYGYVHDVNIDDIDGTIWMSGVKGLSVFEPVTTPAAARAPTLRTGLTVPAAYTAIMHNAMRPTPGSLLVAEEDWLMIDQTCAGQGRLMKFAYDGSTLSGPTHTYRSPASQTDPAGSTPAQTICSSHWFDVRPDGLISVAWYGQGLRLVRSGDMTEAGYWLPPGGLAISTFFHPTDPSVVYVLDQARGIDVLRVTSGSGAQARRAARSMTAALSVKANPVRFTPTRFGFACVRFEPRASEA